MLGSVVGKALEAGAKGIWRDSANSPQKIGVITTWFLAVTEVAKVNQDEALHYDPVR